MPYNPVLENLPTRLTEEATRFLLDYGRKHNFKANDIVVREGEPCRDVYIVLSGRARIVKDDAFGNSNVIALAEQGSIIGEMGVFTDLKRSASIVADNTLTLLELANEDFITAIQHFPALSVRILRSLSGKLNDVNRRLVTALQTHHMLYLGIHMLAQHEEHNGNGVKINLESLSERAGLHSLDLTHAMLNYERLDLVKDLHFSDTGHVTCRVHAPDLRAFLERGALEK